MCKRANISICEYWLFIFYNIYTLNSVYIIEYKGDTVDDFKIGDRVEIIDIEGISFIELGILNGDTGIITRVSESYVDVNFDESGTERSESGKTGSWYKERFKSLEKR